MIVPLKNTKTYGVVHTENYFSFLGFSKKVNSDEIQKVDVYLDDVLIDTIIANKHLQKIEDIYDLEGFGFCYNLPKRYIGEKHTISFENQETKENLQNSPYTLIDSTNENFNEARFLNSLVTADTEKIKNIYYPNSVGFLATKENLQNKDFVNYILQLMKHFPKVYFKAFVFNQNLSNNVKETFNQQLLEVVMLSDIVDIFNNIEVCLLNNDINELDTKVLLSLEKYSTDLFCIGLNLNKKNITVKIHEQNNKFHFIKFFNNLDYLGFSQHDIQKYGDTFHEIYFKKACDIYGVDIEFDINETILKAYVYWNLKLGLSHHEFFKYSLEFARKFAKL